MFKKVSLVTFVLFFTFVSTTFAHTGLESSYPQNGEVINDKLKQITLTFEGKIEQGSTFTLQNANGETIEVDNMSINGNILTGDFTTPLENGDYSVEWSIIGEDGHLIEDSFAFSIDAPVVETTDTNTETVVDTQTETNTDDNEVNQATQSETEAEQNEGNSFIFPIIIGLLILIMIISFIFLSKRKK